jgi:hypothetical protein
LEDVQSCIGAFLASSTSEAKSVSELVSGISGNSAISAVLKFAFEFPELSEFVELLVRRIIG